MTLWRMSAGTFSRKKVRSSSRNLFSSGLKRRSMSLSSDDLEQARGTLAAADAHGDDGVLDATALALDEGVAGHACAAHAVGVADGDGAAVDVELVLGDAELVAAVDDLHREGLVELPQADVVDSDPGALQQPRHSVDRTDAHLVGLAARHLEATEDAQRLELAPGRLLVGHQHAGGGA